MSAVKQPIIYYVSYLIIHTYHHAYVRLVVVHVTPPLELDVSLEVQSRSSTTGTPPKGSPPSLRANRFL